MVLYTPNLNLPYVVAADTVTSYPTTSQDLATKLDARVPTIHTNSTPSAQTINNSTWKTACTLVIPTATFKRRGLLFGATRLGGLSGSIIVELDFYINGTGQTLRTVPGAGPDITVHTLLAIEIAANTATTVTVQVSQAIGANNVTCTADPVNNRLHGFLAPA